MIIFLGAGASKNFDIPTLQEMTNEIKRLPQVNTSEIDYIERKLRGFGFTPDLEHILTVLTGLLDPQQAIHDSGPFAWYLSQFQNPSGIPKKPDLERSFQAIKDYIYDVCQIREEKQTNKIVETYDRFFRALNFLEVKVGPPPVKTKPVTKALMTERGSIYIPVDIVTTNYDLCIENYCNTKGLILTNGFHADQTSTKFIFNIKNLEEQQPSDNRIRLHKLHGSIDWWITEKDEIILSQIKQDRTLYGDEIKRELLIYPTQEKYIYRDPFFEIFHLFQEKLKRTPLCFVIGYSFRDIGVNNIFNNAIKENPSLKIFLIDPHATGIKEKLSVELQKHIYQIDRNFDDPKLLDIIDKKPIEWIPDVG